jgi:hypothetical protein
MVPTSAESIDQIIEECKESNSKYTDEFFELTPKNVLGTITDSTKDIKIVRVCDILKSTPVIGTGNYQPTTSAPKISSLAKSKTISSSPQLRSSVTTLS